jgi:hypothetical protein
MCASVLQERTETVLDCLHGVMISRHHPGGCRNGCVALAVTLLEDPAAQELTEDEVAKAMRLCQIKVYLDAAMVGAELAEVCTMCMLAV